MLAAPAPPHFRRQSPASPRFRADLASGERGRAAIVGMGADRAAVNACDLIWKQITLTGSSLFPIARWDELLTFVTEH
jgi:D-arabinose 1-dehydrogenase-like Zn-dependent alcohol dehydrogenase